MNVQEQIEAKLIAALSPDILEVENEGMMFVEILVCRHTMELPIRN